jgi:hypothetical protein
VRTQLANRLAHGGAITAAAARDLSEGTVSYQDVSAARSIVARLKDTPLAQVASNLHKEITAAVASQPTAATLGATFLHYHGQAYDNIRNSR